MALVAPPVATGAAAQTAPVPSLRPASYVWPKTKVLDYMPIVPEEHRALCQKDYLDWAMTHCPGLGPGLEVAY